MNEQTRWDLSLLYSGIDDPRIDHDIELLTSKAKQFFEVYRGNLKTMLSQAIRDYSEIDMIQTKLSAFPFLLQSTDVTDTRVKEKSAHIELTCSQISGAYFSFLDVEINSLDESILEAFYKNDPFVLKHKPWIEHIRIFKNHILSEDVESALTKRSPFSAGAWDDFFDEFEADLVFHFDGEQKTLTEMLNYLQIEKDRTRRAEILKIINDGISGMFSKYSAQNLYMITGSTALETRERDYENPMEHRNMANKVSSDVVDALHRAIMEHGSRITKRYYRLKAKALGIETMAWSDRNAPLPFADTSHVSFADAFSIVHKAYQSFSPTLAEFIKTMAAEKRIDARIEKGRRAGAYNYSGVFPNQTPASFTFLNYQGTSRDIMVLAHELGHGVHGMLAGKEQGPLMFHAPIAYCETASVFGEMTTFNYLRAELKKKNNKESLQSLVFEKLDDIINTTIRQISFSNFERRIHGMNASYTTWETPKKLSTGQLDAIWLEVTQELYGKEGELFTYENANHLWAYISHFHRPFYVYGYAFGELLTLSIYAKQKELGDTFEPLYLDMLQSGNTKNVVELLKPFSLDPRTKEFWNNGIQELEKIIDFAETLL